VTKFGIVTLVEEGCVSKGQPRPRPKSGAPVPQNFFFFGGGPRSTSIWYDPEQPNLASNV